MEPLATGLAATNRSSQQKVYSRKRKRKDIDDNVEGQYMRSLMLEEVHDGGKLTPAAQSSRSLRGRSPLPNDHPGLVEDSASSGSLNRGAVNSGNISGEPLQHETAVQDTKSNELEKSSRTVFLANVCTSTILSKVSKKTLMDHMNSIIPSLAPTDVRHAVESLRFRSTAFADAGIPRKAAFIKKELMKSTARSTNAYVVYTTQAAAREAVRSLNGTVVLDRHLRVDSVAHPAKQDHRRCVFVGNLGFVDDTAAMDDAKGEKSQRKPHKKPDPADVEEGLWRHFGKAGDVESVRVVRDRITRVGKGFAYVQFCDANAVEKALLLNNQRFPPMLPRVLRVTRAKNLTKTKSANGETVQTRDPRPGKGSRVVTEMPSPKARSLHGRANKLLGRAGAARYKERPASKDKKKVMTRNSRKRAENYKRKMKE